ncbi:unnamed protein product [Heligmosomoides polygyrus]|uniref:Inhibitor_I29 domain-containing protein n=1 Tax=Heligmosomoides polygyrus TaxID=6339 RepID=A0A183GRZ7_HELPZ|nr:unnamed protein product [Heligmosomoides polygyrus]
MKIVVAAKERLYHFFSAYALQTGCSDQAKDEFWGLLNEKTAKVPSKDVIIVAGTLMGTLVTDTKIVPYETVTPQTADLHFEDRPSEAEADDVKAKVREKKSLYHVFLGEKAADNWRKYQEAKKAAKKAMAVAKVTHYRDVNEKFETRDDRKKALKRWRDYFQEISTVESPHPAVPSTAPTHGPVKKITVEEIEAAWKKMRPGLIQPSLQRLQPTAP